MIWLSMKKKQYITIRPTEKEMYRIFKDLEQYGRTTFSYPDRYKHTGIARSIGVRGKPLIEDNLLVPPLSSTNRHRMTGVQLPPNVQINEQRTKKGIRFYFSRKK